MTETLKSLELKALDLDHSVTEAEQAGDEMLAAKLRAQAIGAWEAYYRAQ